MQHPRLNALSYTCISMWSLSFLCLYTLAHAFPLPPFFSPLFTSLPPSLPLSFPPALSLILHMMGEASLKEDTLMRVLVIGLKRELPLSPADALDIADRLVARAASAHTDGITLYTIVPVSLCTACDLSLLEH